MESLRMHLSSWLREYDSLIKSANRSEKVVEIQSDALIDIANRCSGQAKKIASTALNTIENEAWED